MGYKINLIPMPGANMFVLYLCYGVEVATWRTFFSASSGRKHVVLSSTVNNEDAVSSGCSAAASYSSSSGEFPLESPLSSQPVDLPICFSHGISVGCHSACMAKGQRSAIISIWIAVLSQAMRRKSNPSCHPWSPPQTHHFIFTWAWLWSSSLYVSPDYI